VARDVDTDKAKHRELGSLYVGFRSILVNARTPWRVHSRYRSDPRKPAEGVYLPLEDGASRRSGGDPLPTRHVDSWLSGFASNEVDVLAREGLELALQVLHVARVARDLQQFLDDRKKEVESPDPR